MELTFKKSYLSTGILFFFVAFLSEAVRGVHIRELSVPQTVKNGTEEPVILDCDYTLNSDSEKLGLVVKWFFNRGPTPVYQWVFGQKPQGLGILRDRLNLDYVASDKDWAAHRALSINHPTTELTGEWLCRVSTFESEAMKTSKMIVYSPQKDMDIKLVSRPTPESINISCWATGVYPEPKLTITYNGNKGLSTLIQDVLVDSVWNEGAYDVKAHTIIEDSELAASIPVIFDCELKIPNTSYILRKNFLYGGPKEEAVESDEDNMGTTGGSSGLAGVGTFFYFHLIVGWLLFRRT